MNRPDLAQAALAALQPSTGRASKTINQDEARSLRGKMLGVLIRKSRLAAQRSLADCAIHMDAEPGLVENWEYGESEPSLPQLELLARFLNGRESITAGNALTEDRTAQDEYLLLRRRLIGALLRLARESSGKCLDELSESVGLEAHQLQRCEFGEEKLPVSILIALAQALDLDMSYFAAPRDLPEQFGMSSRLDKPTDPAGEWRDFAAESDNLPFIQLAMAFQSIARDDLHRIADALLAIIRSNGDSNGWSSSPT